MEVNVVWWRLRTSNPSKGGNVLGEFDSHTPPPFPNPPFAYTSRTKPAMENIKAVNNEEIIVGFESVAAAIMAEQALTEHAFYVRVMPMPSGIRAGCGFCLRFLPEDIDKAAAFLSERGFNIKEAWEKSIGSESYKKVALQ